MSTTTHPAPLVIVGSSLAGVRAAEGARAHGWTGPITMIGDEPHLPYDRPPLSKAVLDPTAGPTLPTLRQPESWDALDIDLRTETTALGVDTASQVVHTSAGDIAYGALVIATGSAPRTIPILEDTSNTHTLRTFDDALRIRDILSTARRLTILGAGFIGAEVASAAVARGTEVTIVNRSTHLLNRCVGPLAAHRLATLHTTAGVDLRTGVQLAGITQSDSRIRSIHLDDDSTLDTDAVVVGIGSVPATAWLAETGVTVDPITDGIDCDATLATSVPNVWAAGDAASIGGRRSGHWTSAGEQGYTAGANSAGAQKTFAAVPFAWSTWYGHRIQLVGTTHPTGEVPIDEILADDGVIEYRESDRLVGAVAIDNPGRIARIRRELTCVGRETSRPADTTSVRRDDDSVVALR